MCSLIDCSVFDLKEKQKIYADGENFHQKMSFQYLLEDSHCHFLFYESNRNIHQKLKASGLISKIRQNLDIILEVVNDKNFYTFQTKFIHFSKPFIVKHAQNKITVSKQLVKANFNNFTQLTRTKYSVQTGEIWLQQNLYLNEQNIKPVKKYFFKCIEKLIDNSISLFYQILKQIQPKIDNNQIIEQRKDYSILRYFARCTVEPSISVKSQCAQYYSLINRYLATNCGLQDLTKFHVDAYQFTKQLFTNLTLYGHDCKTDNKFQYLSDIFLTQKQKIQSQIVIPSLSLLKPKQNKFVFNHCYFYEKKYPEKKINEGGNSLIFAMKVELNEYCSTNQRNDFHLQKNPNITQYIPKHLIFKKSKPNKPMQNNKYNDSTLHQSQIVTYLRGGTCQYLPKYYLNIEKHPSPYHNQFFVEYLSGDTLDQYLSLHSTTMSITTKLWLILQATQAIRFIKNFGIVHLDIKQQNIIVMRKLIIKLFDFGESYHFKLCGNNHKPKYSLLYASPEVVTPTYPRVFTQKSDVYSLGIMMHHILLGKYPYFFRDQRQFQKGNLDKNLRKKTFYMPQQFEQRSDQHIMFILSQLILKCIDMDEKKRPYLDWIAIILKSCLNYIITQ